MYNNNKRIIVVCGKETKYIIKKRARQLKMDVSGYLKYLAIKDIEELDKK